MVGRLSVSDFRHEALDEVGSTNQECLARARAGQDGCLWVTATRQTGGRGRRGRAWASEPGNLYSSLLLINPAPMSDIGTLPLAVALAVHRAVCRVLPFGGSEVEVKWPNDVLVARRKISGILIEGEFLPDGRHAIVIGIGINIRFKPDNPAYPVACLADFGATAFPEEVFAHLMDAMANVLSVWDGGRGAAAIVDEWRSVACGLGEAITVNLPDRSVHGRFSGIDERGLLQLDRDDGQREMISAGDVFFG